jgi:uncharacterized membrane protein/putative flippase GtrA
MSDGTLDVSGLTPDEATMVRFGQYVLVGLLGLGINEGVLYLATGVAGLSYVVGGALGRAVSILVNYVINDSWTWDTRGVAGVRRWVVRGGKYVATRLVGVAIGLGSLVLLVELFGMHYLVANVVAVGVGVLWGFAASDRWVWRDEEETLLERAREVVGDADVVANGGAEDRSGSGTLAALTGGLLVGGRSRREDARSVGDRLRLVARDVRDGFRRAGRRARPHATRTVEHLRTVDRQTWVVVAGAAMIGVWFVWYQIQLYEAYRLTGADFGSYVHMYETTIQGEGFLQQGKFRDSHPSDVYWGAHFSLTLLLYVPIYALFPSPTTLIVLKAVVMSTSIVLLWLLARRTLRRDWLAWALVGSYAFNPFLWSAWTFDFQEQALLPLLLFACYYAYVRRRHGYFLAALGLALVTNEFMIPVLGGFVVGLGVAAYRAGDLVDRVWALAAALGLVVVAKLVSSFVIDAFSRDAGVPVRVVAIPFQQYDWPKHGARAPMFAVFETALAHPMLALDSLLAGSDTKLVFFLALFLPVLLLSITDELTILPMVPFLLFGWVLGHKVAYYQFRAHYPFYILPFVYIGAVHTLRRTPLPRYSLDAEWFPRIVAVFLLLNLFTMSIVGPLNVKPIPEETAHDRLLDQAVDEIPQDASVVAQNNIYPHLADHPKAKFMVSPWNVGQYRKNVGPITPKYVIYDVNEWGAWAGVVIGAFQSRMGDEYGLYRYQDGIWIWKHGYEGEVKTISDHRTLPSLEGDSATFDAGAFSVNKGERRPGFVHSTGTHGIVWFGPYAVLPPGNYTATFRLDASGGGPDPAGKVDVAVGQNHQVVGKQTFYATEGWQNVTVQFQLQGPRAKVEFRGVNLGGTPNIVLDDVTVRRHVETNDSDGKDDGDPADDEETPTGTPTPDESPTPTETPTESPTPTETPTATPTESPTRTETPDESPTETPGPTTTETPTDTATETPSPPLDPFETPTDTATETPSNATATETRTETPAGAAADGRSADAWSPSVPWPLPGPSDGGVALGAGAVLLAAVRREGPL